MSALLALVVVSAISTSAQAIRGVFRGKVDVRRLAVQTSATASAAACLVWS